MKLDVIKLDGGKGGSIELPDDIFGIEEIRADIETAIAFADESPFPEEAELLRGVFSEAAGA